MAEYTGEFGSSNLPWVGGDQSIIPVVLNPDRSDIIGTFVWHVGKTTLEYQFAAKAFDVDVINNQLCRQWVAQKGSTHDFRAMREESRLAEKLNLKRLTVRITPNNHAARVDRIMDVILHELAVRRTSSNSANRRE